MRGVLLLVLLFVASSLGAVSLAGYYSNYLILQRNDINCVWGYGASNELVTLQIYETGSTTVALTLSNTTYTNPTFGTTNFQICIPQNFAVGKGLTSFSFNFSTPSNSITLTEVVFGEVYLCSGQSNMEFGLNSAFGADDLINGYRTNYIRFWRANYNYSATPQQDILGGYGQGWVPTGDASQLWQWNWFSAVCYTFGISLWNDTDPSIRFPIALITTHWGGTPIETWSNIADVQKNCPRYDTSGQLQNSPQALYNSMLSPLFPLNVKGFIWYQGEANGDYEVYNCLLTTMINTWRTNFYRSGMSPSPNNQIFLIVVLAPWYGSYFWLTRYAQLWTASNVANTYAVSTTDLGDPNSPLGSVHPRNKTLIGKRSELIINHFIHGSSAGYSGPTPQGCCIESSQNIGGVNKTNLKVKMNFSSNMYSMATPYCQDCCNHPILSFTAQNAYGYAYPSPFYADTGVIDNTAGSISMEISGYGIRLNNTNMYDIVNFGTGDKLTAVTHAVIDYPQCALYNQDNIASTPFNLTCSQMCTDLPVAPISTINSKVANPFSEYVSKLGNKNL